MDDVVIRLAEERDLEGIAAFLARIFDGWPMLEIGVPPLDHLRWKIWENPISRTQQLIAEADAQIVATSLTVIRYFDVRGQTLRVREGTDWAVDPLYRGRGLMKALQSRISQDNTKATRPMPIAVREYWMAMTFASWQKTYFVIQLFA